MAVIRGPAESLSPISIVTLVAVRRTAQKHLVYNICHQQKEAYCYQPTHSIARRAVLGGILAAGLLIGVSSMLLFLIGKALEEVRGKA